MSETERLRIWDLGCIGITSVLWTSFEWEDLLTLDPVFVRAKDEHKERGLAGRTLPHLVFSTAHKLCHSENPISKSIQRRLEFLHAKTVEEFESREEEHEDHGCLGHVCEQSEDLPGFLWTLLTDPRDRIRRHGLHFVEGIAFDAVKLWLKQRVQS